MVESEGGLEWCVRPAVSQARAMCGCRAPPCVVAASWKCRGERGRRKRPSGLALRAGSGDRCGVDAPGPASVMGLRVRNRKSPAAGASIQPGHLMIMPGRMEIA